MKLPKFQSKVFLAPMMDINDSAFRLLCRKRGAALVFTELTSIHHVLAKGKLPLKITKKERPVAVQLFGSDRKKLIKAAKIAEPYADVIDYNMGCPSSKVHKAMSGAALLNKPELVKELLSALVKGAKNPVSLKLRAGINEKNKKQFLEIAKIAEKGGVSMITLHARTVEQGYSGKADWVLIKELKNSVSVPVVGNGDIRNPEDAKRMLEETRCDYIMVGRAARGNPFIFKQINDYLEKGKYKEYSAKDKLKEFKEYLNLAKKQNIPFSQIKAQAMYFTKGIEGGAKLRKRISQTKELKELVSHIRGFCPV